MKSKRGIKGLDCQNAGAFIHVRFKASEAREILTGLKEFPEGELTQAELDLKRHLEKHLPLMKNLQAQSRWEEK